LEQKLKEKLFQKNRGMEKYSLSSKFTDSEIPHALEARRTEHVTRLLSARPKAVRRREVALQISESVAHLPPPVAQLRVKIAPTSNQRDLRPGAVR